MTAGSFPSASIEVSQESIDVFCFIANFFTKYAIAKYVPSLLIKNIVLISN